jgi:predicted RNA-binding Zn ribbon-like protein
MSVVPLVGEPLALDFVNTRVQPPSGDAIDFLADRAGLDVWLDAEGERCARPAGQVDLGILRSLRGHVANALEHVRVGDAPPVSDLVAVTAALRAAPAHRELTWNGSAVVAHHVRTGDATDGLLAELAEAAADLLVDPAVTRIRRCAGPGCRMLFLATHSRRQWCSPALCGNRVRVARYYRRHRQGEPA